jgi:hypothetical protein
MEVTMTANELALLAGAVIALAFEYFPFLAKWYGGLTPVYKRLVMIGVLALCTLAVFGLSCAGVMSAFTCDQAGALAAVIVFIEAAIANQAVHRLMKK